MKTRLAKAEKLDNLQLQGTPLHRALNSLAWVNKRFGNHRSVIRALQQVDISGKKKLDIVDIGCGGGDLVYAVADYLRKQKIPCRITGIDGNANSLSYAAGKCREFPEIGFLHQNILDASFQLPPCDVLISSHFMYHFSDDALISFLTHNCQHIADAIIFSELKRSRLALFLFSCFGFLLPLSSLARTDGQLAIKRSFTKKEWISLLNKSGFRNWRVSGVPLFRVLVIIYTGKKNEHAY